MNITTKRSIVKGRHIAVYSRGKMGKTTFLAEAVKDAGTSGLLILTGEDGLSEHEQYRDTIPVLATEKGDYRIFGENGMKDEWHFFLESLKEIYREWAAPGKLLAIDSVDMVINGSCVDYCTENYFEDKEKYDRVTGEYVPKSKREQAMEFGGNTLLKHMATEFDKFLTIVKFLQNKGVTVVTSWHSSVFKWKNPHEDQDYDKICVDLKATKESNLREMLKNNCSMLLYADIKSRLDKRSNRMKGGDRAFLFTESTASYDCTKARGINLPGEIEFDFNVFKKYIKFDTPASEETPEPKAKPEPKKEPKAKTPTKKSTPKQEEKPQEPKEQPQEPTDSIMEETPVETPVNPFMKEMNRIRDLIGDERFNGFLKEQNIDDIESVLDKEEQIDIYSGLMQITSA